MLQIEADNDPSSILDSSIGCCVKDLSNTMNLSLQTHSTEVFLHLFGCLTDLGTQGLLTILQDDKPNR